MAGCLQALAKCRRGTTAIEYALLASLIATAAMGGYRALSQSVDNKFDAVQDATSKVL